MHQSFSSRSARRQLAIAIACGAVLLGAPRASHAGIFISEFMASNATTVADEDGEFSDWIELYNSGPASQNLAGWYLTDDETNLAKWAFPAVTLASGEYLLVFASDKNRAVAGSELHTSFKLSGGGEYLAVIRPDGTTAAHEFAPTFPPQSIDMSYGLTVDLAAARCFLTPTPGGENDESTACSSVEPLQFSSPRGFYATPFDLTITTPTPGVTIKYTLDGSPPSPTHGATYSGPIRIATTKVVRALAYQPGVDPLPPSVAHTYIFVDDVVKQPANVSGYPNSTYDVGNGETAPHDYQMDPSIVGDPAYAGSVDDALLAIPTLSLAVDKGTMFGNNGFYDGSGIEVAASVEVLYPAAPAKSEQANCGVESHSTKRLKRALQLEFKGVYGPSSFDSNLLETGPVSGASAKEKLERIVLRAGNNRSWARAWNPDRTAYTEDEFYRSTQIAMSGIGSHGTFVHLYINGLYWGMYNAVEQPEEHFSATYLGGNSSGWFSTNHSGVETGDATRWEYLRGPLIAKNMATAANYAELQQYLDVESFADYLLLGWYSGMTDWPDNNWYAGNRNDVPGPLRYYAWDGEWSWDIGFNQIVAGAWVHPAFRTTATSQLDLPRLWRAARASPEFMVMFADRVHEHTSGAGALTDAASHARWAALNTYIRDAVVAESARWGDALETLGQPTRTRDDQWQTEVDVIDALITGNAAQLIAALRGQGFYPSLDPPLVSIQGSTATITHPNANGTIYYTTNDSDPRAPGGAVAATAKSYSGAVAVATGVTVRARVKNGSTWSALDHATASTLPTCTTNADCGDANPCTSDRCNVSGDCVHTNNTASCNDGLFCTATDQCSGGTCSGTGARCGGATPFCDEAVNACFECQLAANCDDGVFCNGAEICASGLCTSALAGPCAGELMCDEDTDACVGCKTADDCDDGDACTAGHSCSAGQCVPPAPVDCDDGLYCDGVESCDAQTGCTAGVPPLNCSLLDTVCSLGVCEEGAQACGSEPANEGGDCDDQDPCTVADACVGGECAGMAACDETCEGCDGSGGCASRCGHPLSDPLGGLVASDALYMLQVGVGLKACALCVCDLNDSGATTATDALSTLRASVGIEVPMLCPPANGGTVPASSTTSTTITSTTTMPR